MKNDNVAVGRAVRGSFVFEVTTCLNCGITEACAIIEVRKKFNDFGLRYCRYCGLQTDESGAVVP